MTRTAKVAPPASFEGDGGGMDMTWSSLANALIFTPRSRTGRTILRHCMVNLHSVQLVLTAKDGAELRFEPNDVPGADA